MRYIWRCDYDNEKDFEIACLKHDLKYVKKVIKKFREYVKQHKLEQELKDLMIESKWM